jgi:hypothetical protein
MVSIQWINQPPSNQLPVRQVMRRAELTQGPEIPPCTRAGTHAWDLLTSLTSDT